jgi:hypothetical protein
MGGLDEHAGLNKEDRMRVFKLVVAVATALFLAPGALHSESLAEAAAKEKARRKALADSAKKPVKSYNEDDLNRAGGGSGTMSAPNGPDAAPAAADGTKPAEGGTAQKAEKSEDEKRAEASAAWRKSVEDANKVAANYRDMISKLQNDLNDTSGLYSSRRTTVENLLSETKVKLTESEAKIADLEEQGRRAGYR